MHSNGVCSVVVVVVVASFERFLPLAVVLEFGRRRAIGSAVIVGGL